MYRSYPADNPAPLPGAMAAWPPADGASRLLAHLIDAIIIVIVSVVLVITITMVHIKYSEPDLNLEDWVLGNDEQDSYNGPLGEYLSFVIFIAVGLVYLIPQEAHNGSTLGKRMLELKVMRMDQAPLTAQEATIRNLMRLIWVVPILSPTYDLMGLGLLMLLVEIILLFIKSWRTLADRVAGTRVISVKARAYRPGPYHPGDASGGGAYFQGAYGPQPPGGPGPWEGPPEFSGHGPPPVRSAMVPHDPYGQPPPYHPPDPGPAGWPMQGADPGQEIRPELDRPAAKEGYHDEGEPPRY